ncbi:MAG: nickel pincer cofactor biosynthesis protein LarB [Alphaproteobacteria bacterium]|nr:nickel pincer cofactor biosynthesis protein LarB [Alphaproteobacteria bacterium]MBQ9235240.1 nickel pincer cofactor biosynthesis protein LarB [Alphaproteobacteria bacterium]
MADSYTDIGFAKLDLSRAERTGLPETIFCSGKTAEQLHAILTAFGQRGCSVLGTRCSPAQAEFVIANGAKVNYDATSQVITLGTPLPAIAGKAAVCCAGTADLRVAEEAAQTLEFFGVTVERHYDVGVAGLHRLLSKIEAIRTADVIIAVAGMEGALASVVAGLVKSPVIAVPTSVGYGASFNGLSALLAMLNSCAEGVSVVNIDNGFGAAVQARRILQLKDNH